MNDVSIFTLKKREGSKRPWQVRWRSHGRNRARQFANKGAAERFRAQLQLAVADGVRFDPRSGLPLTLTKTQSAEVVTVYDLSVQFMARKWPDWAGKTRASAVEAIEGAILTLTTSPLPTAHAASMKAWLVEVALLGHNQSDLDPLVRTDADQAAHRWLKRHSLPIELLSTELAEEVLTTYARRKDGKVAAATTISRKRTQFGGLLKYAVRIGCLPFDPLSVSDWRRPLSEKPVDPAPLPTVDQARALLVALDSCGKTGPRLRALFATLFFAGLRVSEAVALQIGDLQLPKEGWGEISVARAMTAPGTRHSRDGDAVEVRNLKWRSNEAVRHVPIPAELVTALREHLARFPSSGEWVFTNLRGNPWDRGRISRTWSDAKDRSLPKGSPQLACRPYDLRHANASMLLNLGASIPEVAARLGHSPDVLLSRYANVISGDREKTNALLDAHLA